MSLASSSTQLLSSTPRSSRPLPPRTHRRFTYQCNRLLLHAVGSNGGGGSDKFEPGSNKVSVGACTPAVKVIYC
jgi:hypothetical protein